MSTQEIDLEEALLDADGKLVQKIVKVGGKPFRCSCGCNVFHHPRRRDLNLFACNACDTWFRAD